MLVLSRQENQRIRFPGLGISVEILGIKGSKVRVGVRAPSEIRILRDELEDYGADPRIAKPPAQELRTAPRPSEICPELRDSLRELGVMMRAYCNRTKKPSRAEDQAEISADTIFESILERLNQLSNHHALTDPSQQGDWVGQGLFASDAASELTQPMSEQR